MDDVTLRIGLRDRHQVIDGFGVNINPVGHWRDGALVPVLDLLIDDYGARLFRLDPYGSMLWVDPDGTGSRELLSAERLAQAYRSGSFRDAWETARYLNQRGIQPLLNVSGTVPHWMCGDDGETLTDLEGYADLVTSLARWARVEEGIAFSLFGPFNETDLGPPEGPSIAPAPLADLSVLIAERFQEQNLGDVGLVLADQGHYGFDYLREIVRHEVLRDRMAVAGMHMYRDQDLSEVPGFLAERGVGECRYWLTEYGDLDQTGSIEWDVAENSVRRLIRALNDGVQGAMVWDAYDNWHDHDKAWTIWGLIRVARHLYTPKKRYHAGKQLSRFVPPGSTRVAATCNDATLDVVAFHTLAGGVSLVILNEAEAGKRLIAELTDGIAGTFSVYVTDRDRDCERLMVFPVGSEVQFPISGRSITTLTSVTSIE